MPSWKKLITSGSQAALNTLEINPQPTTGTTTHGANLQIVASGSATQFGLLITGSTGNGTPLAMIQTPVGGSGTGEFIYGRGIYGEESFRIRQGAGGSGTFALYCSSSFERQFITHQFSDPTQGAVSYVNYSEDSRSNAYFGIGTNNPTSHLHVSGNIISTGDMRVGNSTVEISGSAGTISASGAISASDLYLGGGGNALLDIDGSITASGQISASGQLKAYGANFAEQNIVNIGSVIADGLLADADGSSGFQLAAGMTTLHNADLTLNNKLFVDGLITSSGDLHIEGNITASAGNFSSHITSSGNISASGTNHTLGGRVSINYGNGASMTGSLSNGEGYGEIVHFGIMSSAVSKGDVVTYRQNTAGWIQADKDAGYQTWSWMGVCIDPGADGSTALTGAKILLKGVVRLGAGHIADSGGDEGDPVYVQDAGHVTFAAPGSGDFARIVGYVIDETQDIIYLDPSKTWVEVS